MSYIFVDIKDVLQENIKTFDCLYRRNNFPFCILLIYTDLQKDLIPLIEQNIRCADKILKINTDYYAIIFFANKDDSHISFSNKILYLLESNYPTNKFAIGVACKMSEEDNVVIKVVQNVLEAQENSLNTIVDNF